MAVSGGRDWLCLVVHLYFLTLVKHSASQVGKCKYNWQQWNVCKQVIGGKREIGC